MNPQDAIRTDRSVFDSELDSMIDDAINNALSTSRTAFDSQLDGTIDSAFSAMQTDKFVFESELDDLIDNGIQSEKSPLLKHHAIEDHPSKRLKTAHEYGDLRLFEDFSLHPHPSRTVILGRPEVPQLKNGSSSDDRWEPDQFAGTLRPVSNNNTSGNMHARRKSSRNGGLNETWPTLSNTVLRQWDPSKDDMGYELLLEQRRKEKVQNVDRYVPEGKTRHKSVSNFSKSSSSQPSKVFPLELLPEKIKARIFRLLLISQGPITIDLFWLRPFVKGHARIPNVMHKLEYDGTTYTVPVSWEKLLSDVELLRRDMLQFAGALETRGVKMKGTRSPCRGLSTSLLRVSRNVHKIAAYIFYGRNVFRFPCATSAWMELDSFLATIGRQNVASIQHIHIHAPLWHRGVQEDFVEGAIVDSLSPASRLAMLAPPPHDRLVSAIRHATSALFGGNLVTLSLALDNGVTAYYWSGGCADGRRLISVAEAEEFVERKCEGIRLLKRLSDILTANHNRPLLSVSHSSRLGPLDKKEFLKRLPALVAEAEKYGWEVDTYLEDLR